MVKKMEPTTGFKDKLKKNAGQLKSLEGDAFKLELSLNGKSLGYLAIDNGFGCIKGIDNAASLIACRLPGCDKMYIKVEGIEETWLTHWDVSTDNLGASEFGHAVAWRIKSGQLISDFNSQSLGIRTANDTNLNVRDDYLVLNVRIIR
jgi:hypothetical protein